MSELYKEILYKELGKMLLEMMEGVSFRFEEMVQNRAYMALKKIKTIVEDKDLSDRECFDRIEKIVCVFEEMGSDGGSRHDFG